MPPSPPYSEANMNSNEVIAKQATRLLELESQVTTLKRKVADAEDDMRRHKGYLEHIAAVAGYQGHYGNLASAVDDKIKGTS